MLAKVNRLLLKTDFENVRENGKRISGKELSVVCFDSKEKKPSRFGFIVSKKISTKSHDRNKVKRILRALIRKHLGEIKEGCDFVILVRPGIIRVTSATIETSLIKCLKSF